MNADTNATDAWREAIIDLDCGASNADIVRRLLLDDPALSVMIPVAHAPGVMARGTLRFQLLCYVDRKGMANTCRKAGRIESALRHEAEAEKLYRTIPKAWRW